VVHCHADHFEPEEVAKRFGSAADIRRWLERQRPAIPTLFVKCPIGFRLDKRSRIGMSLHATGSAAIEADYLRALVADGVGIGLHVHHESWTRNTLPPEKFSPEAQDLHEYAARRPMDHERMSAMVEASLAWLRDTTGLALDTWHFVHGCWAFGASDPEICQLETEVPLLYSHGCRADFSFPAGRRYCDPPWTRPQWIVPAKGVRASERGDPRDEHASGRMLVWASATDEWRCGLDTYTQDSRRLMSLPDKIERYLAICPVIRDTAYIKTCSHGMHSHYWQGGNPTPTLGAFARELVDAVGDVEFMTSDQVVNELR